MKKSLMVITPYNRFRYWVYRILRWPYTVAAIIGYLLTAVLVYGYLSRPPVYKSEMSLVMPGTGFSNNVNLADVGQATAQTLNPFSGAGFNPRVNYKEIIVGRGVVAAAAKSLAMDPAEFGQPQVLLTEQTSILHLTLSGRSGVQAKQKALALYDAFQTELDRLRKDESLHRDASLRHVLDDYLSTMTAARQRIVDFQQNSVIVAAEQVEQLTLAQSALQDKLLTAHSDVNRLDRYVDQLSRDLGVSPALAGQAFTVQSDAEFRGYLRELNESASLMSEYASRWGDQHPKYKSVSMRYEHARVALLERSRNVLGVQSAELLYQADLQSMPNQAQLYSDLVSSYAQLRGAESMVTQIENDLKVVADKLRIYSREAAQLEKLQLEYKMAEAVYTTAVARLDASKADIFASYPVVQILTNPSDAWTPSSPRNSIAIAAGVGGCFFITMAILVLWQRRFLITLLLKRS